MIKEFRQAKVRQTPKVGNSGVADLDMILAVLTSRVLKALEYLLIQFQDIRDLTALLTFSVSERIILKLLHIFYRNPL